MSSWDDVRRLALALPETTEEPSYGGLPAWKVRGQAFVWDRPLRGTDPPVTDGPVLGVRVADLDERDAVLASEPAAFTIPHLDGYPAVLLRLDEVPPERLAELVEDAWLSRAPKRLAAAWLAER